MNKIIGIAMQLLCASLVIAQKKPIDYSAIDSWPHIQEEKISNDGRFILYNISSKHALKKLVIQSSNNSWKTVISGATDAMITEDGKRAVFENNNDSIGILELGTNIIKWIDSTGAFKMPLTGSGQWLAYQSKNPQRQLTLIDLFTGRERKYPHTNNFTFSGNGNILVLQQTTFSDNREGNSLLWVDLNSGLSRSIWQGEKVSKFKIDRSGTQISFLVQKNKEGEPVNAIWYYNSSMDSARVMVDEYTAGMEGIAVSDAEFAFSNDGGNLFFFTHCLKKMRLNDERYKSAPLIIWGYKDKMLSKYPSSSLHDRNLAAVINLQAGSRIVRLETENDDNFDYNNRDIIYSQNKVLICRNSIGRLDEYKWRPSARPDLYIISTLDGSEKLLKKELIMPLSYSIGFSPTGKFAIFFDRKSGHWFSYAVGKGKIRDITKAIPFSLSNDFAEYPSYSPAEGLAGWLENDSAVLLYDNFDIWQVDPEGIEQPVNITHGYGRKNKIRLRRLEFSKDYSFSISAVDTLVLFGFDIDTKNNGFLKLAMAAGNKLTRLSMDPMIMYFDHSRNTPAFSSNTYFSFCLKAKNANIYLLKPTSAEEFPNLCISKDLNEFLSLTNLAPQKSYNWYTNSLVKWKEPNGTPHEGILYKPEDFNPNRKYPLIIYVYEKFSDALHVFINPDLSDGSINIPWYVSHGYLVLAPDINYKIGHPGQSAYKSVLSGVRYLSKMYWVDIKRIALQGHSFGGFETNYILTKTNIFAAASSSAGLSDLITESGQFSNGTSKLFMFEASQMRIGSTVWQKPELYIENSSIFRADKVSTPLLILHNTSDESVSIGQGVEWFNALRRLGKKSWMLQYVGEYHTIEDEANRLDFSVRLNQFFDHYLKGAPMPEWMTKTN